MLNAMTIDVEEYFHVSAFSKVIRKDDWVRCESRVAESIDRLLELFECHNIQGTFFVLGWVAKNNPELIRKISTLGHEVASHGMFHDRVTDMTRKQFHADITDSKLLLESITGVEIKGYRAPSFSLPMDDWAYELLAASGYKYSSSIYPVKHDHYGEPDASRFSFVSKSGVVEYPISTIRLMGRNLPIGGGGFFRLLPSLYYKSSIDRLNNVEKKSSIFYLHPWEIDENQPRQQGISYKTKFRHYLNLGKTFNKLDILLKNHHWSSIENVYSL